MKTIATILAALVLACTMNAPAHAATAFLVNCEGATSVTGRFVYVGTYNYAGKIFQRTFSSWCPYNVEVF